MCVCLFLFDCFFYELIFRSTNPASWLSWPMNLRPGPFQTDAPSKPDGGDIKDASLFHHYNGKFMSKMQVQETRYFMCSI